MADLTCPECGTVTELPAIRRAADEFCRHCDYPLFWTPSAVPAAVGGATADATLRRLPGAGGRQRIGSKVCPECGELNPLGETACLRCGADLDARAPEPVFELPEPEPEPVVEPEPEPGTPWWWWAVLVAVLTAAAIAAIVIA